MRPNQAIPPAIEACYDAAFEFGRWPAALQELADSLGVTSCVIRTRDDTHPFRQDQRYLSHRRPDSTEHAEFAALWLDRIEGAPDPHAERARRLAKPVNNFTVEDEITTPEERKVLPYHQEIAVPGHREWWACLEFAVRDRRWYLSMFRDTRRGRFETSEAGRFLALTSELSRIVSFAEKVWDIAVGASLAAFDQFNCPAVLLDSRGRVTQINRPADALFGPDLAVHHGRIHAGDRASDSRLQALIGTTIQEPSDPVVVERDGSPWLLAEAIPVTSFVHDLFNGGDVLLFFTNLAAEAAPADDVLRHVFHLTPAEARLASRFAAGGGIEAVRADLAIGRETARTQLRAVFDKTGTRRQAELVALLSRLRAAPVRERG